MTHKSLIWRDIDKHPLPDTGRHIIDVKLSDGSILIACVLTPTYVGFSIGEQRIEIDEQYINQWRDAT